MYINIEQIIENYIKHNVSPNQLERNDVTKRYKEIQNILEGMTFQNGSYTRHTAITPVNDLDVFYIVPQSVLKTKSIVEAKINPNELDIQNILSTLAKALRKEYPLEVRIVEQAHSVGIFFGSEDDFSIDVVPAIPYKNELYLVPESSQLTIRKRRKLYESNPLLNWILSDPKGYIEQAKNVDFNSKGCFRKAVKFVKKWKHGQKTINTNFPLKSFHLELVITNYFKNSSYLKTFESIKQFYRDIDKIIIEPQIRDKADQSKFIDSYLEDLSPTDKNNLTEIQNQSNKIIKKIEDASTNSEAIKNIELLLQITHKKDKYLIGTKDTTNSSLAFSKPYLML